VLRAFVSAIVLCVSATPDLVRAQSPRGGAPAGTAQAPAPRRSNGRAASPSIRVLRATALSLLATLAEEARGYEDQVLRVRVQAKAADALWDADAAAARGIFIKAWDAAEVFDRETAERSASGDGGSSAAGAVNRPSLRPEVLRLVALRDPELGESFLRRLTGEREPDSETSRHEAQSEHPDVSKPLPPALIQRLRLARQLLGVDQTERASAFAAPALAHATPNGIAFLSALREKDQAAADRLYQALLSREVTDPAADANTVSILSSYVFTPFLVVTVSRDGATQIARLRDSVTEALAAPSLRAAFMQAAASMLLRPPAPPDQDYTSAGRAGEAFVVARLLPLFEQYSPQLVPALRERLSMLAPDVPEATRQRWDGVLSKGFGPEASAANEIQDALNQAGSASSIAGRDDAYVRAAVAAAKAGDARAQEFADKIDSQELRERVRAYVDFVAVERALAEKEIERALQLSRSGELTHLQRVWVYTEAAKLLIKVDLPGALQLLDEAAAEARRMNPSGSDKVRALTAIATRLADIQRSRAWELMTEAVKAANKIDNFPADEGHVGVQLQARGSLWSVDLSAPAFDLTGVFVSLAREEPERAIELARSLSGAAPRSAALIAIARTLLSSGKRSAAPTQLRV
jgi:hypothetical protein